MKVNLKSIILLIITSIFMYIGNLITLYKLDVFNNIGNKWILIFIYCLIILFTVIKKNYSKIPIYKLKIFIYWGIFTFSIFLSKMINGDFVGINIFEIVLYTALIPLVFFSNNLKKYENVFLLSYIFSLLPLLLKLEPLNSLGILLTIGYVTSLNILYKNNVNNIFNYIIIIIFFLLIYLTMSRTALLAFIIISIINIVYMFKYKKKQIFLFEYIRKLSIVIITAVIVVSVSDYLYNLFFNKWSNTSQDLTSGRIEIWRNTVNNNLTLFGNGENYFWIYGVNDAHNTFIQVLGDYGLISFILFTLFSFFLIIKCIRIRKIEYISFFGIYFILGLAENLFFFNSRLLGIHILFFFYLGCLINEKNINYTRIN